jgi:hypothetical protein
MQIMYVETCPDCDCVVVRAPSGETKPSRLMAGCTGCGCHKSWQKAQSSQQPQEQESEQFSPIVSGS